MKGRMSRLLILIIVLSAASVNAQLPSDSWNITFGGTYARFINHSFSWAGNENYGGFIGLQRNVSEHVGFRLQANFVSLQGKYGSPEISTRINSFAANLDLLYFFAPCEPVTPYFVLGLAPNYYMLDSNRPNKGLDDNNFGFQINGGMGIDWSLGEDWKLRTEFIYRTVLDNKFDGVDGPSYGGLFGGPYKSYFTFDIGFVYAFDKGEPSKYCQLYSGISLEKPEKIDYDRIEEMIKAHIPKEVVKEVAVQTAASAGQEKWILVGVNFDTNKSTLKIESYPILYDAVKTLLLNPDMRVEIQGYTDNIGSESYNKRLSEKRAEKVKEYLVSKGVASSRLTTVGFGENNPVADNKTADGRAMNRRIEFKIQ